MSVPPSALVTDLYQLTMMQGFWRTGKHQRRACFDLYFRSHPFGGGYTIAAGLEEALRFLASLRFSQDDLEYLAGLGLFEPDFLTWLEELRFGGDVSAIPEGKAVFPLEPLLRVEGPIAVCQLVETPLLNTINFQTLIATKAARICQEAGEDNVMEFGLRRAQGVDGALTAARAAYIGGCASTSNVHAGKTWGIPVAGTQAHSWILPWSDELAAFRAFVEVYPRHSILLVDTYDTLRSGVPNAIKVGLEMRERGERLLGVRLDSGDRAYLSIETRRMLDEAGLTDTRIVCSGDLDEYLIRDLRNQGARIDSYGVGTNLVTAKGEPALSGVYKLAAVQSVEGRWRSRWKRSDGAKATLPGIKEVWRLRDGEGQLMADLIELAAAEPDFADGLWGYHPTISYRKMFYRDIVSADRLLEPVMREGRIVVELPPLQQIRLRVKDELAGLHPTFRRIVNPHVYKVSLGQRLQDELERMRQAVAMDDAAD